MTGGGCYSFPHNSNHIGHTSTPQHGLPYNYCEVSFCEKAARLHNNASATGLYAITSSGWIE